MAGLGSIGLNCVGTLITMLACFYSCSMVINEVHVGGGGNGIYNE